MERKNNAWATRKMDEIRIGDPKLCVQALMMMISKSENDEILANIAAGPLEDLLAIHGVLVVDEIIRFSDEEPKVKKALGAVWRNDISDEVWEKIKKIADPSW